MTHWSGHTLAHWREHTLTHWRDYRLTNLGHQFDFTFEFFPLISFSFDINVKWRALDYVKTEGLSICHFIYSFLLINLIFFISVIDECISVLRFSPSMLPFFRNKWNIFWYILRYCCYCTEIFLYICDDKMQEMQAYWLFNSPLHILNIRLNCFLLSSIFITYFKLTKFSEKMCSVWLQSLTYVLPRS